MVVFSVYTDTVAEHKPSEMLRDVYGSRFCLCLRPCLGLQFNSFDVCKKSIKVGAYDESSLHAAEDIQSSLVLIQYDCLLKKGRLSGSRYLLGKV
jgi:hypothetical protein